MLSAKSVIPECCIDSNLFDVLLNFEKESVNHTKGNATVIAKMENKFKDSFCVGIIDKDKRDLIQIKTDFEIIEIEGIDGYFNLFKHKRRNHYLIQMVPEIETWICKVIGELNIELNDFQILINANTPKELALITKKVDKKRDPKFKALFKEVVKQSFDKNFLPVLKLKKAIVLILEKNHQLDLNDLKNV
jgi:hypothetical protein